MSQVMQGSASIAANSNSDVLENKINAIIDPSIRGAIVRFACTGSATGLEAEGWVGQRNPLERSGVSTQNRIPLDPDDIVAMNIAGRPNERIRFKAFNTTAGALTFFYRVTVDEL